MSASSLQRHWKGDPTKQTPTCCSGASIATGRAGGCQLVTVLSGASPHMGFASCRPHRSSAKLQRFSDLGFDDLVDSCTPMLQPAECEDVAEQLPFIECYCKVLPSVIPAALHAWLTPCAFVPCREKEFRPCPPMSLCHCVCSPTKPRCCCVLLLSLIGGGSTPCCIQVWAVHLQRHSLHQ